MSGDDPMDRARAALASAREARGASEEDEDEPIIVDPRDPLAAAEAVLARARAAREAARGGRSVVAEARARKQLERLKAQADGSVAANNEVADEDEAETEPGPAPRVRRL